MTQTALTRRFVFMGSIFLLGFALRTFALNLRGLWYDEAFAIFFAARSFGEMIAGTLTQVGGVAADVHPLFYYFSLHLWMQLAGDSIFAVRFYSVFFGMLTIPVVFCLARDLFGRRSGMVGALVVALAPFHIAYSQEARMYAQLGFWSALAFLAFVQYRHSQRKSWWLVFVIAGAASLYSHNLAFVGWVALGIWSIIDAIRMRTWHLLRATVLAGTTMVVLWSPWLIVVPSQFGKIEQAYWVPVPSLVTFLQTLLVFTFDFDNATAPRTLFPVLLFGALILPIFLMLEIRRHTHTKVRASLAFAATMAVLPIALLFLLSQWRPVYIIRVLIPAFIWYAILVSWLITSTPLLTRWVLSLFLIIIVTALLPTYYAYTEFPRSPFDQAAQMLRAQIQPGDVILHDNKMSFFPMYYYDRELEQTFLADPAGSGSDTLAIPTQRALNLYATSLETAIEGKSRVWFVIFQIAIDQASETGQWHSNLSRFDAMMNRRQVQECGDLRIILYEAR